MKALRRAWNRVAGSLFGKRRETELNDEFEFHIQMLTEENLRRGIAPVEARRLALVTFGGLEAAKESYRDQRGAPVVDVLRQDVGYALRGMRRNPGFTAIAVACLALGIGASTAIFSLFNALLLRQLPVAHPEQLIFFQYVPGKADLSLLRETSSGYGRASLPYATYAAFRDNARALAGVFVFVRPGMGRDALTVGVSGRALTADGEMVTEKYFSVLGVSPIVGRAIIDSDMAAGAPNVVVISHRFWLRELGGERSAVGRSITINTVPFTIVGVASPGFSGLLDGGASDLWVPLRLTAALSPWGSRAASNDSAFVNRRYWWCTIGGRLKPGVNRSQALAETEHLFRQSITAELRETPVGLPALAVSGLSPASDSLRQTFLTPIGLLAGGAGLVLLIACANVATLLLARAKSRQKEIGVRLAIGASRARIIRQLVTESVLLSLCGGACGFLFAYWVAPALLRVLVGSRQIDQLNVTPDTTVLLFTAAVSLASGVLFGLAPAFRASRSGLAHQLTETAAATTPRQRLAKVLVASQVALSVVLLFGAGLFVRTLRNLDGQQLGFEREDLLLFEVAPDRNGYEGARGVALHNRLRERIERLPGVRAVTFSEFALLSGWSNSSPGTTDRGPLTPPGQPDAVYYNRVGPGFFQTMGMRILLGRGIEASDPDAGRPVAVVNESLARACFPNENPVGRRISAGQSFNSQKSYEIVGVVENAKYDRIREAPPRTVYLSYGTTWDRTRRMCFAVRADSNSLAVTPTVREAIRGIDPNLPLFNVRTQRQQIQEALGQERMVADISGCFSGLALLLVAIGVYGTLSYAVTQRTGEIGIRMALGSSKSGVVWMILRESLIVAAVGLAAGLPVALASSRLAASILFGVSPHDGVTLIASAALLAAIAIFSALAPASRASRIDPIRALRHE